MAILPHQSTPVPQIGQNAVNKNYVDTATLGANALFSWNHTDVSQFTLVDPGADGWSVSFVAATSTEAEHIRITAPGAWTTDAGEAYLIVNTDNSVTNDYEVVITHGFFDAGVSNKNQTIGVMARYIDTNNHVSVRWRQSPSSPTSKASIAAWKREASVDTNIADSLELAPLSSATFLSRTHLWTKKNIVGGGWARVTALVNMAPASTPALLTDRTIGFGIFDLSATGTFGGETIKIYDFIARTA